MGGLDMTKRRLHPSIAIFVLVLAAALAFPTMAFASQAVASPAGGAGAIAQLGLPGSDRRTLLDYARTTYASLVAMTNPATGLPADRMNSAGVQGVETSTTNIGGYMWSTGVADALGVISHRTAVQHLDRTLHSLEIMERHSPDGQYYNWYDHNTLQKLAFGGPPRLSSVDNGWLAAGLKVVYGSVKEVSSRAKAIYDSMDFGVFHRIVYPGGPNSDAEADATGRHGERNGATYQDQH